MRRRRSVRVYTRRRAPGGLCRVWEKRDSIEPRACDPDSAFPTPGWRTISPDPLFSERSCTGETFPADDSAQPHRQREDFNLLVREAVDHPASDSAPLNFTQARRLDIDPAKMPPQSLAEILRRRIAVVARNVTAMLPRAPSAAVAGQPTTVSRDDDVIPIVPAAFHIPLLPHPDHAVQE